MAVGVRRAPARRAATSDSLRVAVYTDTEYWRSPDGLHCTETFSVFAGRLRSGTSRLVLVGRTRLPRTGGHLLPRDVELLELPSYPSLADPRAALAVLGSLRAFWRGLRDVDAVWLLGPHPLALAFAGLAVLRRRRVVLGVRQDLPAHMRTRHPDERWLIAAADVLEQLWRLLARVYPTTVVGPDLADRYRRARHVLPILVSLVEAEDVLGDGQRPSTTGRAPRLISVGRLDPEKNPLLLADVLSRLRSHDDRWTLVVCGDGTQLHALGERVSVLGLQDAVRMAGALTLDQLMQEYRDADVLLHVSWTEGVPQVLFEAFAAGIPVVATDVGGVAAATEGASLLIPPGDAEAAAAAVERVVGDELLRGRLVQRGRDLALRTTGELQRKALLEVLHGRATA